MVFQINPCWVVIAARGGRELLQQPGDTRGDQLAGRGRRGLPRTLSTAGVTALAYGQRRKCRTGRPPPRGVADVVLGGSMRSSSGSVASAGGAGIAVHGCAAS